MANWQEYIPSVMQAEGGYQEDLEDIDGNYINGVLIGTNYGISAPTYAAWLGYTPTKSDMMNMPQSTALQILKIKFWDKMQGDKINNQAVAEMFIDQYVNAPKKAVKYMQEAINSLGKDYVTPDNHIGTQTINAINNQNPLDLFLAYKQKRLDHYEKVKYWDIVRYNKYINGWKKRVSDLYDKHINLLTQLYSSAISTINNNKKTSLTSFVGFTALAIFVYRKYFKKQ